MAWPKTKRKKICVVEFFGVFFGPLTIATTWRMNNILQWLASARRSFDIRLRILLKYLGYIFETKILYFDFLNILVL